MDSKPKRDFHHLGNADEVNAQVDAAMDKLHKRIADLAAPIAQPTPCIVG